MAWRATFRGLTLENAFPDWSSSESPNYLVVLSINGLPPLSFYSCRLNPDDAVDDVIDRFVPCCVAVDAETVRHQLRVHKITFLEGDNLGKHDN